MNYWPHALLRIALSFILIYPAVSALYSPGDWIIYIPDVILNSFTSNIEVLYITSSINILIGAWILSNKAIRIPTIIALVISIATVILNPTLFDRLLGEITAIFIALTLLIDSPPEEKSAHV